MLNWYDIGLCALAVLMSYLCISVGVRSFFLWRAEERELRLRRILFPGKGIDVSQIAPEIRRVREEPLAALRARRQPGFYHQGLLAAARRWISQLPFFHHEISEHEPHKRNT